MNFVGSVILHICNYDKRVATLIFVHLMIDKSLRMESLFLHGLPELHVMNYTFDKCI